MRLDAAIDQPAEQRARAVGDVAGNVVRLETEALLGPALSD